MSWSHILVHLCFITPVCQYFLRNKAIPRTRGFLYAIMFLIGVTVAMEYQDWRTRPSNYFDLLDVDRDVTPSELKKAYKKQSLLLHPDKNNAPDAAERFAELSHAYEVLSNNDLKKAYDKFGPDAVKNDQRGVQAPDSYTVMIQLFLMYVTYGIMTFLLTIGKESNNARTWSYAALLIMLIVEIYLMFTDDFDPLSTLLPRFTKKDKSDLFRSLYPSFMSGARVLSIHSFVDIEAETRFLLHALLQSNKEMLGILGELNDLLKTKRKNDGATKDNLTEKEKEGIEKLSSSAVDSNLPAHLRLKRREAELDRTKREMDKNEKGFKIPSWMIMLGLYAAFNYFK